MPVPAGRVAKQALVVLLRAFAATYGIAPPQPGLNRDTPDADVLAYFRLVSIRAHPGKSGNEEDVRQKCRCSNTHGFGLPIWLAFFIAPLRLSLDYVLMQDQKRLNTAGRVVGGSEEGGSPGPRTTATRPWRFSCRRP